MEHCGYHLVMTNSLPWKDPPVLRTVNHLFLNGPFSTAMLNNQRVTFLINVGNPIINHVGWCLQAMYDDF